MKHYSIFKFYGRNKKGHIDLFIFINLNVKHIEIVLIFNIKLLLILGYKITESIFACNCIVVTNE